MFSLLMFPFFLHAVGYEISPMWLFDKALKQSDTVEIQKNSLSESQAEKWAFDAQFSPVLSFDVYNHSSRLATSGSFGGDSNRFRSTLGFQKKFKSGTTASVSLFSDGGTSETFQISPTTGAFQRSDVDSAEIRYDISLRQSFWRNSFGHADRKEEKAFVIDQNVKVLAARGVLEDYGIELINQYYVAWAAFNREKVLSERLKRERKRFQIYEKQHERGFLDDTDFLQLQSSLIASENQLRDSKQQIRTTLIRLGNEINEDILTPYLSGLIQVRLKKEDMSQMKALCESTEPFHSFAEEADSLRQESLKQRLSASENKIKPDFFLEARLAANAVKNSEQEAFEEATKGKFPMTYLGLGLRYTFGVKQAQSELSMRKKQLRDLEIRQRLSDSRRKSDFLANCSDFFNSQQKAKALAGKIQIELKMVDQLDKKYRVGKVDLSVLAQAENSLAGTQNEWITVRAEMFANSWRIKRDRGQLKSRAMETLDGGLAQ